MSLRYFSFRKLTSSICQKLTCPTQLQSLVVVLTFAMTMCFEEANLQLHPGKCAFAQSQVQYLVYILSEDGISPSAEKVKAMQNYPTPKNVRDVRAFLGLVSFYRWPVPDFAHKAKTPTVLTRKDQMFIWGQKQQEAFETLKDRPCTAPMLSYPEFKLRFILATDASGTGISAILSQVQNGAERVIGYASRQKNRSERVLSASESDLLTVVWTTKHFRPILLGKKILLRNGSCCLNLRKFFSDRNSKLLHWSLKLSELDFFCRT